jgi:uncharacterized DUF497 family protein
MAERGIRRKEVRWILANGNRKEARSESGDEQRWMVEGYVGNGNVRVVFIERANEIRVVTVMWIE